MRFASRLPADYEVHVVGAPEGRRLDFAVGRSRDLTMMFDVRVNTPARNIVLVLGSSRSALWAVQASAETSIVGVWLAGPGKHEVIGVNSDVPVLTSDDSEHACRRFYVSGKDLTNARNAIAAVLGREPRSQVLAKDGEIVIGEPPVRARARPIQPRSENSEYEPAAPPPGDRGLEQLVQQGKLRPATVADYHRWVKKGDAPSSSSEPSGTYLRRTYLVTGPMTFPSGLYGAHLATFILLPGVPFPKGDPGHSQVLQGG